MSRFFLFLLLLIVGCGLIFLPMVIESGGFHWLSRARPAEDLPQPWKNGASVKISSQDVETTGARPESECPDPYVLNPGDTLGTLAQTCGISLAGLLSVNPQITNPNQVFPGQAINIPQSAGRGGGSDLNTGAIFQRLAYSPDSAMNVSVEQMPPGASVRVGIGLSTTGYHVLQNETVGQDGCLSITLIIPADAVPGDRAFVLITTEDTPSVQVISEEFVIGE